MTPTAVRTSGVTCADFETRGLRSGRNRISPVIALLAFAVAMVILAQGIKAPFVKDAEPQAAGWIQDVASGRHILLPTDYYGELARKPALFYWLAGAITAATGGHVDEVRARIVSVVAGASIAVAVLIWSARFLDFATGCLAFLFLLGSFAFTSRATLALEDMLLVAFMFVGWCLLYPTIEEGPSSRRVIAISLMLGLGILTKGPLAIVLPAFAVAIYLMLTRRSIAAELHQWWPWAVLTLSVAIALPWYIPALMSHGRELATIVFQENVGHFLPAGPGGTNEAARPLYYIAMKIVGGTTPLNLLLPCLAVALIHGDFIPEARRPLMFHLSFFLASLIFFTVASAKRDDYVLPAIPSLAILLAAPFTSLRGGRLSEKLRDVAAIATVLVAALTLVMVPLWISTTHRGLLMRINPIDRLQAELLVRDLDGSRLLLAIVVCAVVGSVVLIVCGVRRKHPMPTAMGLGSLSLIGVLIFTAVVRPELSRMRTLKYVAGDISRMVPGAPIYVVTENEELSFYLGRKAPQMIGDHNVVHSLEQPAYLFAYQGDFMRLPAPLRRQSKLKRQWERLGKAGSPALYLLQPARLISVRNK